MDCLIALVALSASRVCRRAYPYAYIGTENACVKRFTRPVVVALVACWAGFAVSKAPPVALANVYEAGIDLSGYWVSEKLDGVRALWDGEALYSRRGYRIAGASLVSAWIPGNSARW